MQRELQRSLGESFNGLVEVKSKEKLAIKLSISSSKLKLNLAGRTVSQHRKSRDENPRRRNWFRDSVEKHITLT